jgi:hypothetical protein
MGTRLLTVNDILAGHVSLDVECLDRVYLNGYVPNLQVGGQVVQFLTEAGFSIPSPALIGKMGDRFREAVRAFAASNHVPVVKFDKNDRKITVMTPHLKRQAATGRSGVAAIGVAQEFQRVATCTTSPARGGGAPHFGWGRADRRVSCFYFYLWDVDFGPAFIKVCAYFPYPIKVWLNGHHWAQQQATKAGLGFTTLSAGSNSFASCTDPVRLQQICDRLGPATIGVFFQRWCSRLPLPLTPADRANGYWWELSMRQVEVSRTMVFDHPRNGRAFFEALVADNLDIGRPDHIELIFGRQVRSTTTGVFATRVVTTGVDVTINALYKHSRVKQYFKDGRAMRIETVINNPTDLGVLRRLPHLDELQAKARDVNRRLLDHERVGQGCVLASPAFERIARPSCGRSQGPSLALRRPSGHGPGRRPGHQHQPGRRVLQQDPAPPGGRAPRPDIRPGPLLLRPTPPEAQRPDHPPGTLQHLRPDPRRTTLRDHLHQSPQPTPATPPGRRPATSPTGSPASPAGPRTHRRRLHSPGTNISLKVGSNVNPSATKGR